MFDKLLKAQQKAGEIKKRLDNISVWVIYSKINKPQKGMLKGCPGLISPFR